MHIVISWCSSPFSFFLPWSRDGTPWWGNLLLCRCVRVRDELGLLYVRIYIYVCVCVCMHGCVVQMKYV